MNLQFPYQFDTLGRTAQTDDATHLRDLIEQVLFTSPGERVNRPTFGTGLLQMNFSPNSPQAAAAVQMTVQGALQQWLGDRIIVQGVDVSADESTLTVTVAYVSRADGQRRVETFDQSGGASLLRG